MNEEVIIDIDKIVSHWIETSDEDYNTINLNARYNDFKREFYSQCTHNFTNEWIEKIKIIRTWIKEKL
jgi:hypothetical protein